MGSFLNSLMISVAIIPNKTPRTIAPPVSSTNKEPICKTLMVPPLHNYKLMVNKIIQVPSFSKLSPSIKELNFLGAPDYLSNARTATVSVQDKIAPNIKACV